MLRAHLHGKLARTVVRVLGDRVPVGCAQAWHRTLSRDEDTLTAATFERISYLSPALAWEVLRRACVPLTPAPLPSCPPDEADWLFWPSWTPAEGDSHRQRVEPDVAVVYRDLVLVVECKLHDRHSGGQWTSQIRAARRRFPGRKILFCAVGGGALDLVRAEGHVTALGLTGHGESTPPLFALPWRALRNAADELAAGKGLHRGERRIVEGLVAALADRGYARRTLFGTLRGASIDPSALASWRPAPRAARGFASIGATEGLHTTCAELLRWRPT